MNTLDSLKQTTNIYTHMQAAVDIVAQSPHPTNKIAATIATADGKSFSRTNHWPSAIEEAMGRGADIGNSSGTIHAETACIFAAYHAGAATKGASLFITDPPCPNCMKNMAEAGITHLYIDHKGFAKDWANRRGDQFETMSMRIASKAGMNVFVIYRKEERFEIISANAPDYKPVESHPPIIEPCNDWQHTLSSTQSKAGDEPFSLALATDNGGETVSILLGRHPTIGYTDETVEGKQDKYSFILQPLGRLLMIAARKGLKIMPDNIYSSRAPTARELVNFIGAGFANITIGDKTKARDEHGPLALEQLTNSKILHQTDAQTEFCGD